MHGYRGRRLRDFGIRLNEKQKLRAHYSVLERQFRRYVTQSERAKGNTGEVLLQTLERRLDNVVRRAGFTRTIWAARQMVVHGHVTVNGRKVDRPSCSTKLGDEVAIRPRGQTLAKDNMESMAGHIVPSWMSVNPGELKIKVLAVPSRDEIPFDVNVNLIVEFYR
jgi:small subunit ribosomal protein S4